MSLQYISECHHCSCQRYSNVSHMQTFNGLHQSFPAESVVELFIKNKARKYGPDPACSTERQVKCHVWKIGSSNFQFVKRVAGIVSRSFFAERVHSCVDDSVCPSQDCSPVFMLLICT